MRTRTVEFTNGINWGKFLVGKFDEAEWARRSAIPGAPPTPLLRQIGWGGAHVWVLDLQTGEGACFRPGGSASADLEKHQIWVCPMYEIFLKWFYRHPEYWEDIEQLQELIEATDPETMAASALYGRRRPGPNT